VPSILPRLVKLKSNGIEKYVYIESIIKAFIEKLFKGYHILSITQFRITKNADVELDNNASDFLKEMENYVNRRKWGFPVRLEIDANYDEDFFDFLMNQYDLPIESIYKINGPINLGNLFELYNSKGFNHLKYKYHSPRKSDLEYENDLFKAIQEKDYLLHRPYERFDVVNELIEKAVNDARVLAIKQTLYRVSGDSKLVKNLARAAKKGKQVTVLVELKARFDEKQNIEWAKRLEKSGCHVVYGFSGFKVHSKILLIIREEDDGIKKYLHFSTGNYNDQTAKLYTDIDLITANPELGQDASNLFNLLTGYHLNPNFNYLKIAPINLKESLIQLINNEILNVKKGKKGYILAKMNSLVDASVIDKLYEASQAGVKIDLIIRGMSCIRPGMENLSENITVKSIIGKYLEHSRLSYFYNGGNEKVFISSADWRPRNLYRRVEQMVPIYDEVLKKRIKNILIKNLEDTENSWIQEKNGDYTKLKTSTQTVDAQDYFFSKLEDQTKFEKENFLNQIKNKFLK
jgi:polyphosphate kinase